MLPLPVDPVIAVPQWAAQAAMWHIWTPPRRLSDDDLAELRLDLEACRRALDDVNAVLTEELRRRDDAASATDSWHEHR